jgi:hypothetical protein
MSKHAGRKIAKALGICERDGLAYGLVNGLFFCIRNDAFTASVKVTANRLTNEQVSDIRAYINGSKKRLLIRDMQYEAPCLQVFLDSHYAALTVKRVLTAVRELAAFLQAMGIASACESCGKSGAAPAFLGDAAVFLCDGCYNAQKEASGEELAKRQVTGSYLKGFLGAAIGGLIGIVPWVVFGLLGRISALSGLIMAYTCMKMYRVFRGRIGRPMVAINLFILVCFTVIGVFASWVVSGFVQGYQDLEGVMRFIFADLTITGIPGDIIIGLLLAGLGSFFLLKSAFRTASGKDIAVSRGEGK